jgi:3-hydroxyisobutyrate dehydrogenase-like beta-hydroxyacid dehydrogenase
MTATGFVGLGAMGSRIAARLLEGNHLYRTNRARSRASKLARRGMAWRDIAAFIQVLARAVGVPGSSAGSGMVTAGTGGNTP